MQGYASLNDGIDEDIRKQKQRLAHEFVSDIEVGMHFGGFAHSDGVELLRDGDLVSVLSKTKFFQVTGKWSV